MSNQNNSIELSSESELHTSDIERYSLSSDHENYGQTTNSYSDSSESDTFTNSSESKSDDEIRTRDIKRCSPCSDEANDIDNQNKESNDLIMKHTCLGCQYGALNQLAHMDPGGCLYVDLEN